MRPVLVGDIFALASELAPLPPVERHRTCARLLQEADWADKYRKRRGALHPRWGNGSLMGRVGIGPGKPCGSPAFQSPGFCASVVIVLEALQDWRDHKRACSGRVDVPKSSRKTEISP